MHTIKKLIMIKRIPPGAHAILKDGVPVFYFLPKP